MSLRSTQVSLEIGGRTLGSGHLSIGVVVVATVVVVGGAVVVGLVVVGFGVVVTGASSHGYIVLIWSMSLCENVFVFVSFTASFVPGYVMTGLLRDLAHANGS